MKFNLDRRKKIGLSVLSGISICVVLILFVYLPMMQKITQLRFEQKQIQQKIEVTRNLMDIHASSQTERTFLHVQDITKVLDEITSMGQQYQISFLEISPRSFEEIEDAPYSRLPIYLKVESTYQQIGQFLASLEGSTQNGIFLKEMDIDREEEILPKIQTNLILEVVLKNDGQ